MNVYEENARMAKVSLINGVAIGAHPDLKVEDLTDAFLIECAKEAGVKPPSRATITMARDSITHVLNIRAKHTDPFAGV